MLFWTNNNVSLRIYCELYAETERHQIVYPWQRQWTDRPTDRTYFREMGYMPESMKWNRKTMRLNACTHVNLTVKAIAFYSDVDEFFQWTSICTTSLLFYDTWNFCIAFFSYRFGWVFEANQVTLKCCFSVDDTHGKLCYGSHE